MTISNLQLCSDLKELKEAKIDRETSNGLTGYPHLDKPWEKNAGFLKKHPIIPNASIYDVIYINNMGYLKNDAVDCLDLKANYLQMFKDSKILSAAFKELGVRKGDIITCSLPNYYQAIVSFLAANRIGAIVSFLNSFASADEIKKYLNLFESSLFINYNKGLEFNKDIKDNTKVEYIVNLKKDDVNRVGFDNSNLISDGYNIDYSSMGLIGSLYKKYINPYKSSKLDSLVLFTSGTTGNPKPVLITNENFIASSIYLKNSANILPDRSDKCLACVPFCYPYGFMVSTLMSLICGREVILAPNLSSENINYYLEKNPNVIFGSPALLELIKKNCDEDRDLSSIHTFISGGDFLTKQNSESGIDFFKEHGANVQMCCGSGNAETSANTSTSYGLPQKYDTVGRLLVGTDAVILNRDTLEELGYGQEGILFVRGKHVFKGYFGNQELTEGAFIDYKGKRYFNTETLGFIDIDGYFTLTGRKSRFYIMSSLNKVYCDHVQNIINSIEGVDKCAVVKMPHDELLYVSKAYIVMNKDFKYDCDLLDYIRLSIQNVQIMNEDGDMAQIKDYEIPFEFEFVEELPLTKADKIDYFSLEKDAEESYKTKKKIMQVGDIG